MNYIINGLGAYHFNFQSIFPFSPADLKMIPYIDQLLSQRPSTETVFLQQDNGNGPPNGQRVN